MNTYLVRMIGDPARPGIEHELVGIFTAGNMEQLREVIDEACPPDDCECAKLPAGGIMWDGPLHGRQDGKVPLPVRDEEKGESLILIPWSECGLSDRWFEVFYGFKKLRWEKLVAEEVV